MCYTFRQYTAHVFHTVIRIHLSLLSHVLNFPSPFISMEGANVNVKMNEI